MENKYSIVISGPFVDASRTEYITGMDGSKIGPLYPIAGKALEVTPHPDGRLIMHDNKGAAADSCQKVVESESWLWVYDGFCRIATVDARSITVYQSADGLLYFTADELQSETSFFDNTLPSRCAWRNSDLVTIPRYGAGTSYHSYPKHCIGWSDIAALLLVGKMDGVTVAQYLHFAGDKKYSARIVDSNASFGDHYRLMGSFSDSLTIYCDNNATYRLCANTINIYRAGDYGCIIQLLGPYDIQYPQSF